MPNIGVWEIVIVVVIAFLVFGPRKLPELGSSLGRSISGFKKGLQESKEELNAAMKEDDTEAATSATTASAATSTTEAVQATATTATSGSAAKTTTETPATTESK